VLPPSGFSSLLCVFHPPLHIHDMGLSKKAVQDSGGVGQRVHTGYVARLLFVDECRSISAGLGRSGLFRPGLGNEARHKTLPEVQP
jgi:hypothetical protein